MTLKENAIKSYDLRLEKEELEKQVEELKQRINELETEINELNSNILEELDAMEQTEITFDDVDVVATKFSKTTKGYNDVEVIKYLKENNLRNLITIKESLDKRALNKELKNNEQLDEALKSLYEEKVTSYVVVTSVEKHQRMMEHIENNAK